MGNTTPKPLIDANLQYRPVASRHYYTLPANSIERRVLPPPLSFSIEPPRFHPHAKGKNIRLDSQLRRAARKSSFCNGVTFSQRPVRLYEKVRLRLSGVHSGWSGALRFGFTSLDPGELAAADIPKYACPDLVTRPGYWAKALPERLALRDNVLAFWADRHGRVFYSINEGDPVLFHCGLNVGSPLWAIIDIYGITQEVTLLESTFADSMSSSRLSAARLSAYLPQSNHDSANYSNNQLETNQAAAAKMATLQLGHCNQLIPCCSPPSSSAVSAGGPRSPRGPPSPLDTELHFHPVRGSDVILSADRSSACIHFLDSSRTLVFSERPLHVGETLFVQAGHLGLPYFGALLFGVTSCDPGTLRPSDLPADPDVLLDRKEYWVVYRGIPTPSSGDVLSFTLLSNGEVHHGVNGAARGRLLCVDASQVLWVFFTLHGAVNRLRILGTVQSSPISSSPSSSPGGTPDDSDSDLAFSVNRSSSASESSLGTHFYGKNPNPNNDNLNPYPATAVTCPCTPMGNLATPNNLSMCSDQINQRKPHNDTRRTFKRQSVTAPSSPLSPPLSPAFSPLELPLTSRNGECTVCFDQEVDTVIYTCGHMCLCKDCGLKLKKQINACCPICRRPIKDVIKTYRP